MLIFNVLSHNDKISSEVILIKDYKTSLHNLNLHLPPPPLPPKNKKYMYKFDNIVNKPGTVNKQ